MHIYVYSQILEFVMGVNILRCWTYLDGDTLVSVRRIRTVEAGVTETYRERHIYFKLLGLGISAWPPT